MTTSLYLIRHAESAANVQPVVSGMRGDAGLTDRGRIQAGLLAQRLQAERFQADVLYTSSLPRALETAEYVGRALRLAPLRHDGLQELRPGEADGMSLQDWQEAYPPVMFGASEDPFEPFSPGGESLATFQARAGGALTRLVAKHEGHRVVAITHGGVVEASFYLALGLGVTGVATAFASTNTSITHWQHCDARNGRAAWTLITFNDAHHLENLRRLPHMANHPVQPVPVEPASKETHDETS